MEVNGFLVVCRCRGTSAQYYIAQRGQEVFSSKDEKYLIRKCREQSPPRGEVAATPRVYPNLDLLGRLRVTGKGNYEFD